MKTPWKKWFDDIETDEGCNFGGNCFYDNNDVKSYFKGLEKTGAKVLVNGDGNQEDTVIVELPKNKSAREAVFLYVLTNSTPTDVRYTKKKDILQLTWG